MVNPSSAYEIYDAIDTKDKKIEIVESSFHVIITQENFELFHKIKEFILEK